MRAPGLAQGSSQAPELLGLNGRVYARAGDGELLRIVELEVDGQSVEPAVLSRALESGPWPLDPAPARPGP